MKMALIIFVSFIQILALSGCTSIRPIDTDISQKGLKDSITVGEEIDIRTKSDVEDYYTVVVKSILEEKIIVEDTDKNEMEFYYKDIEVIEREQIDVGMTGKVFLKSLKEDRIVDSAEFEWLLGFLILLLLSS